MAWEKAPSANNLLRRLGNLKATLKASVISDAPKALAMRVSLTSPKTRDNIVILLTFAAEVKRFTSYFPFKQRE
jgi:hypothetical protein